MRQQEGQYVYRVGACAVLCLVLIPDAVSNDRVVHACNPLMSLNWSPSCSSYFNAALSCNCVVCTKKRQLWFGLHV